MDDNILLSLFIIIVVHATNEEGSILLYTVSVVHIFKTTVIILHKTHSQNTQLLPKANNVATDAPRQ